MTDKTTTENTRLWGAPVPVGKRRPLFWYEYPPEKYLYGVFTEIHHPSGDRPPQVPIFLDGKLVEYVPHGESGWQIDYPAFYKFLNSMRAAVRGAGSKKSMLFYEKYERLLNVLWVVREGRGRDVFFNPVFFPRTKPGKKAFLDLVNLVSLLYGVSKGGSSGRKSRTTALNPEEQKTVGRLKRAGKDSIFITEEIGLEKRKLSDAAWLRKRLTLRKAVQREIRRRAL